MALILNQSQAEAVYSAMCALNEVSHTAGVQVSFVGYGDDDEGPSRITVVEDAGGHVEVIQGPTPHPIAVERHANQSALASAYGLSLYGADPLQGAANWLVEAHPGIETSALAGKLSIGYNRAKRLHDATSYGLNPDEPQSAVAAAAGGLTQVAIER